MKFLLQLHVGPVQGFIATARRTRDLWFGSYLLSEVSKSAALCLGEIEGVSLIFPSPTAGAAALQAGSDFLVANVILAEIECPSLRAACDISETVKEAARKHWRELCEKTLQDVAAQRTDIAPPQLIRQNIWQVQQDDVLQLYASIAQIDGAYADAINTVRDLMARRKSLGDFAPIVGEPPGLPKSSLDGARSTVMHEEAEEQRIGWREWRRRLGIEPGEQLDVAGLVKRVAGRARKFVPVARIAADEWLERVAGSPELGEDLTAVASDYDALVQLDLATRLDVNAYPWAESFRWDAQLLFPERMAVELRRPGLELEARARLDRLAASSARLFASQGHPGPYYALLLADGDRMGEMIDRARSAEAHRSITRALSEFAQEVPVLVGSATHRGACIYSGGDDVLALVRLDRAVGCARALSLRFTECLQPVAQSLGCAPPTLSVGIAICHMLEPLGDARRLAKEAEGLAKHGAAGTPSAKQRNALALMVKPRGGSVYSCRIRWDDAAALHRLGARQGEFLRGELPAGLPYELRDALATAEGIFDRGSSRPVHGQQRTEGELFDELWAGRLRTILRKKQRPLDGQPIEATLQKSLVDDVRGQSVANLINELLVARWLSGRTWDRA